MAQTKKKRRRKHRGTQAGTIERPVRAASPRTKQERRELARRRRLERFSRPPTWRGAFVRATFAAAAFGVLWVLLFDKPLTSAVPLSFFMILVYVPLTYMTDRWMYERRRRLAAARSARPARGEEPRPAGPSGILGRLLRGRRRGE
jgi:Flp pilus assembly protein TadB